MTLVMTSNFERFLQFITLDTMKKKTNTKLMPYMSVIVLDDMNVVKVCCKALMIGKTFERYTIMLQVCFKMAPAIKRENIQCIFNNKSLITNFLVSLELHNT